MKTCMDPGRCQMSSSMGSANKATTTGEHNRKGDLRDSATSACTFTT